MEPRISHSLVQSLRAIPDFSALDEKTLLAIVGESMNLFWQAGSIIFQAKDKGEALYVMLEGECSIHEGRSPEEGEVAHPEAGDAFGEMSLLLDATHSRTATAVTDCEILVLPKSAFTSLLEAHPSLAAHFEKILKARLPLKVAETTKV